MTAQSLALALTYGLHLLATVAWVGSLAALALLVIPAAQRSLEAKAYADLLERIQRRLDPLGWLCLAVLVGTGMFQMSANPHYEGFLAITNPWATAILLKHGVIGIMILVSGYITWVVMPSLRRNALLRARGMDTPDAARLQRRDLLLLRLDLILSVVVLILTALARAA